MITKMVKLRVMGPVARLPDALTVLQDAGAMHVVRCTGSGLASIALPTGEQRHRRHYQRMLEDIEWIVHDLGDLTPAVSTSSKPVNALPQQAAAWARTARRTRRTLERLARQKAELETERALIERYRPFLTAFQVLLPDEQGLNSTTPFHVLLRAQQAGELGRLRAALHTLFADQFELRSHALPSGEVAVLVLVPHSRAAQVERLLADAGVHELALPAGYAQRNFSEALQAMLARHEAIPREVAQIEKTRADLATGTAELQRARRILHDCVRLRTATELAATSGHAFVVEGWTPVAARRRIERALQPLGELLVIEEVSREEWAADEQVPVALSNPALLQPFELLVRVFPLPRYGTIDPTPFVAVFFPLFFGLITGDVGYGLALLLLGLLLHKHSRPDSVLRSVARIALACSLFAIAFGFVFGEFFGNLGHTWFGFEPLWFNREEGLVAFLILAVSLGVVHVLIGLVLGAISARREHPRAALGRGISALMIVLIVLALLAAVRVVPPAFFTPAVVGLLAVFPVLIIAEGIIAPIELLTTVGNILSYARVMALGTASVIMAMVANRMTGAMGSVIVGVLFALLFHIVNFALAIFSPTVHALRLHYVEFFGKFFSPGGTEYQPLAHWSPATTPTTGEFE
jgi:V/A-type H+-transporting ATPase subunit I